MFKHVYYENLIESNLKRIDNDGPRYYIDDAGNRYTSVTSFLSTITDNSGIENWRRAVGEEAANFTSKLATAKGTRLHKAAELFLNNYVNHESVLKTYADKFDWKIMKPKLVEHIDNIVCQEFMLCSKKLGLAGTVDCIADFNGRLSVIDFKTSSSDKSKDDIENYFLQCACYAFMMFEQYGITIKNIAIFMVVNQAHVLLFEEPTTKWIKKLLEIKMAKTKQIIQQISLINQDSVS